MDSEEERLSSDKILRVAYVTEMFPTATRGIGPGLSYHMGATVASTMPVLMGLMQDRGIALANIMFITIAITLILSAGPIWLGPETRGRNFNEPQCTNKEQLDGSQRQIQIARNSRTVEPSDS